jgi:hypothetical protein
VRLTNPEDGSIKPFTFDECFDATSEQYHVYAVPVTPNGLPALIIEE